MSTASPVNMSEITSLVSAGQTEVDRSPDGESIESPWLPVTRADEDQQVRQVPRPRQQLDVEGMKQQGMSHIALGLAQVSPISIPPEVNQHGNALVAEVERLQQLGFEALDMAEKAEAAGDWGVVAACKIRAAEIWGSATPLRQELAMMAQQYQLAALHNDRIAFQQELLRRHPWAARQKEFDKALAWAEKTFGATREEVLGAHPRDILAGLAQYEQEAKAQGRNLSREPVDRQAHGAAVKAKAEKMRSKGKLTPQQQAQLVAEMLRGVNI